MTEGSTMRCLTAEVLLIMSYVYQEKVRSYPSEAFSIETSISLRGQQKWEILNLS